MTITATVITVKIIQKKRGGREEKCQTRRLRMLAQLTKEPAAPDSLFGWTFAPVLFAGQEQIGLFQFCCAQSWFEQLVLWDVFWSFDSFQLFQLFVIFFVN